MKKLLLKWLLLAISLVVASWLTSLVVKGFSISIKSVSDFLLLLVGIVILSLANATIGKLIKLLLIPLNCLTLGIVGLIVNACLFMVVGNLHMGFTVDNFISALLGSILYSAVSAVLGVLIKDEDKKED